MNTLGWLFILAGILIARQVARGRVTNISEDLGDAFIAVASGDTKALTEVLTRTGDSATPTDDAYLDGGQEGTFSALKMKATSGLAAAAINRGSKAKGYKWTATGPDYYDCSGLMWRACQDLGYKGARFTTFNVGALKAFKQISPPATQGPGVTAATVNDLVVWPTHHMGVLVSGTRFYSARSVKSGISEASVKGFRPESPKYYRYVG